MDETFYHILPNGVKIVHRATETEVAYVGVMVGAGTRDEHEEENGLAHYIEHCVFKGAATRGKTTQHLHSRDIINRIEDIGGEINAYTTKEETVFYAATPTGHFTRTLRLLADIVLRPTFPKKETDKEVEVILDEIDSYQDSPSELIYDDFENLVFAGHSLAMPILGTRKSLRHISRSARYANEWMAHTYRPERIVVFSQGKLSPKTVFQAVAREFDDEAFAYLAPQAAERIGWQEHEPVQPYPTALYRKHTHQMHVMLGRRAYPIGHEKQLALYLLNNILGGGAMSSRLNMALREQKGLVYTIESQYTPLSDTGYWSIYFAADSADKEQCMDLIRKQLEQLRERPLTASQLQRALTRLHGQMAISAENRENNALAMGKLMLYHNQAPTWQETFRHIEELNANQLWETAQEMYDPDKLFVLSYE